MGGTQIPLSSPQSYGLFPQSPNTVHTGPTPPMTSLLATPVQACSAPPHALLHLRPCLALLPLARSIVAGLGCCPTTSPALPRRWQRAPSSRYPSVGSEPPSLYLV
uniref:Uncharacterized protein n=1 Tax=Oryza meridionalis TaxID=40149 RepID=A0A0E0D2S5_9ORYZ